ncbi:hypothetical protein V6N13_088928 [Hibiscus sabdariffa]
MFPLFLLFYLLVTSAASVAANHACREQRCGHGPPIRFPFRLKGVHSHHCGYGTGFHLSCSSTNATVMELPSSLELVVSKIDYEAQLLHLSDPTSRASTPQVVAVVLGSCLLAIVVLAIYKGFVSDKLDKENQTRIKKFLEDYKAVKPSRYSYADIKRIIKQFKEELGQGAYWNRVQGMAIE